MPRLVNDRSPTTPDSNMPLAPTPSPETPTAVAPPETVWIEPPGVASKMAPLTTMPLPGVEPLTVLSLNAVM